ncbi:MAG: hypothetical protein CMJ83_16915 [Planctomycetes bacterium]|nr:hypothetical protein [Planctomycetota bacterium]
MNPLALCLLCLALVPALVSGQGDQTRTLAFPALGATATETKVVDPVTGDIVGSARDAAGHLVDVSALRAAEILARAADPDLKLGHQLQAHLTRVTPTTRVPVMLWLRFDAAALDDHVRNILDGRDLTKLSEAEVRKLEADAGARVAAEIGNLTRPFGRMLDRMGLATRLVSEVSPVVVADATPGEIRSLAQLAVVDTVYLETRTGGATNTDANATHRTDRVHQYGVKGRNIRIAIMEDGRISGGHAYLNNLGGTFRPAGAFSDHVHAVAGCTASRYGGELGAAPDSTLWSANFEQYVGADIIAAGDWIATQNVDISNLSFYVGDGGTNQPTFFDRYFEYHSRYYLDSYVVAAGNTGNTHTRVTSPARAWNVISVGSHSDGGNGNWTGDVMASSSGWLDPSTGVEKPNLAANGVSLQSLTQTNPWHGGVGSGTSYASPHVAGNLANSMVVNSAIRISPEAAMALMMATAWHNIEGSSRLSEKDGAGGLHGLAAFRTAKENRVRYETVTASSFSNNGYYTTTINLTAGERTRVVIAWGANSDSGYNTQVLDADLDIAIYEGNNVTSGTYRGGSLSFNNNFEIVEFTPQITGLHTIRINDYRFDGTSERVGIAWSRKYRDISSYKIRERTDDPTAANAGPSIGNPDFTMDVDAAMCPNATYIVAPSLTRPYFGGPGAAYSPYNWQPLTYDALTEFWLFDVQQFPAFDVWENSIGVLNSAGQSSGFNLFLENDPSLIGLTVYHIGITLESGAGYADNIKEFSEVLTTRVLPAATDKTRSDDGHFVQALPAGFSFFSQNYTQCYVNMNGNITFGGPSVDYSETTAELLSGRPRIAFLWDDLNPAGIGMQGTPVVRVREILTGPADDQLVVIEFADVPIYGGSGSSSNTVRVTLFGYTGEIKIEHLNCSTSDAIVGISPGNGISSASEIDLTSSGQRSSGSLNAMFETFTGTTCSGSFCFFDWLDVDSLDSHWNEIRFIPENLFTVDSYRMELDKK